MCYAIPGKLVEIKDRIGVVEYFGERRKVLIDFVDVAVGDYVYAQGGVLINKISQEEAQEILATWQDIFFELKKTDMRLAEVNKTTPSKNLLKILQKINLNQTLKREELFTLLELKGRSDLKLLFDTANNIRQKEHSNACCVHGIIEFSNFCRNNCFYCGIRTQRNIKRYRMSVEEIVGFARYAVQKLGFKALVLQSGEDYWYNENKLVTIIKEIKKLGILIFVSIGSRSKETYKKIFEAGAKAALLRFETSNKKIFKKLRPNTSLEERLDLIKYLKDIGYLIATGFLIGLPGETYDDIINNILLTKALESDMYSFGPFIPTQGTPLQNHRLIDKELVLKMIAVTRLVDKGAKILVTTALETLDKNAKKEGLLSGANSLMINVTPSQYRRLYRIYDHRAGVREEIEENIKETVRLLYSLGRAPTDLGI